MCACASELRRWLLVSCIFILRWYERFCKLHMGSDNDKCHTPSTMRKGVNYFSSTTIVVVWHAECGACSVPLCSS